MQERTEPPLSSLSSSVAIVLLLAVVSAVLAAVIQERPSARSPRLEPIVRVLAEPPLPAPTGSALIDAVPWGRIERIESASGESYRVPAAAETPIILDLPVGVWTVALSNPQQEDEQVCELVVELDSRPECLVEFERLSVDQYFREAGWWR